MQPKTFSHIELLKKLPLEVKKLFEIFGVEIRLVGGCVRDMLLKKSAKDFDFATKFLPQEVIEILEKNKIKAVPTGVKFGTITAVVNGKNFEITTLRKDNETDGRHCEPEFVDDYFFDAARRDFTINALYLDSAGLIYDYFDGISDLQKEKVKFIGNAQERIREDFLRILRFFRFSCSYAKSLDLEGFADCIEEKDNLKKLSRERIRQEFLKIISSEKKENLITILQVLKDKKIIQEIFSAELDIKAFEALFEIEEKFNFTASLDLKIAVLFLQKNSDLKVFAKEICATNLEKKYFQFFLWQDMEKLELKDLKQLLLSEKQEWVLDFYLFDLLKNFSAEEIKKMKTDVEKNIKFIANFSLPEFPLKGEDVMQLGFKGKAIGKALDAAKEFWIENEFKPKKIALINFLKTQLN